MVFEFDAFSELYLKDYTPDESKAHPYLWHYTNANGLMGIVSPVDTDSLTFWFTRSDCLNDSSEGENVIECLRLVGKELYASGNISQDVYDSTLDRIIPSKHIITYPFYDAKEKDDSLKQGTFMDYVECEPFLCCFSLAGDELDMWRYYSKTGDGYSLELLSDSMFHELEEYAHAEIIDTNVKYVKIKRLKVLYEEVDKQRLIKEALLDAERAFQSTSIKLGEEKAATELNGFIDHIVQENQFRFKHPCFSSEREYRFIAYRPIKKPRYLQNELAEIKYRIQSGVLIPYIELHCDSVALARVQLGPFAVSDFAEKTTRDYLEYCGLNNTSVVRSALPVRY